MIRPATTPGCRPLNAARAAKLKEKMTWKQVGEVLAREDKRPMPYGESAVLRAVKAWKAGQR